MRILILDDDPARHRVFAEAYPEDDRVHAYKYTEAIAALQLHDPWDIVYLDHDLGDFGKPDTYDDASMYSSTEREYTGADVAWFISRKLAPEKHPTQIIIHSWNPDGAQRMKQLLQDAGIPSVIQPYRPSKYLR